MSVSVWTKAHVIGTGVNLRILKIQIIFNQALWILEMQIKVYLSPIMLKINKDRR